jgi:hypothetical protein
MSSVYLVIDTVPHDTSTILGVFANEADAWRLHDFYRDSDSWMYPDVIRWNVQDTYTEPASGRYDDADFGEYLSREPRTVDAKPLTPEELQEITRAALAPQKGLMQIVGATLAQISRESQ